jgi:hypothetical protein
MAASCPSCGRPVAMARPLCLYCGKPLPAAVIQEAARQAEAAASAAATAAAAIAPASPAGPARSLVVVDYEGLDGAKVAAALGVPVFEIAQRIRRGGWQLQRIAPAEDAAREAERLGQAGLRAVVLAEAGVRAAARPVLVSGGFWDSQGLTLRTESGPLRAATGGVLLVVRGPITREYPPAYPAGSGLKRLRTATLEPGYRFHLHREDEPRPLEMDPASFDFGVESLTESSLLLLSAWVEKLAAGAPVDDRFRREPPALAPAAPETSGIAMALGTAGRPARKGDEPMALDNLEQFRFYSAWRAAVVRHAR